MKYVLIDDCKEQYETFSLIRAKFLYNSDWFRKAKEYAEKADGYFIITTEYGIIRPYDYIGRYYNFLDYRSDENIKLENLRYLDWIGKTFSYEDELIFILNKPRCYEYLLLCLENSGFNIEIKTY